MKVDVQPGAVLGLIDFTTVQFLRMDIHGFAEAGLHVIQVIYRNYRHCFFQGGESPAFHYGDTLVVQNNTGCQIWMGA